MFITPDFRRARRIPFNLICAVLISLAASQAAKADELAVWNFNDSNLNVDHGSGILTTTINPANVSFAAAGIHRHTVSVGLQYYLPSLARR